MLNISLTFVQKYDTLSWTSVQMSRDWCIENISMIHVIENPPPQTTVQLSPRWNMMMSSNENIFRVTGHLCGEFTVPGEFPTQRSVTRSFDVFFDLRLNKRCVNNREAGDLRRYRAHYDVTVMNLGIYQVPLQWWHMNVTEPHITRLLLKSLLRQSTEYISKFSIFGLLWRDSIGGRWFPFTKIR